MENKNICELRNSGEQLSEDKGELDFQQLLNIYIQQLEIADKTNILLKKLIENTNPIKTTIKHQTNPNPLSQRSLEYRMEQLPNRIRMLMQDKNSRDFAITAGISFRSLNHILDGGMPSLEKAMKIAYAAGVTVDQLLSPNERGLQIDA